MGERTAEKGYKAATVYSGMESVQELGGGVCQVASTLYYCTLYADLEVVSRAVHTFSVDYVPMGMDATVYWGSLDYQFGTTPIIPLRSTPRSMTANVDIGVHRHGTPRITMKMDYVVLSKDPWETKEKEITDWLLRRRRDHHHTLHGLQWWIRTNTKYDKETDELISEALEGPFRVRPPGQVVAVVPPACGSRQRTPSHRSPRQIHRRPPPRLIRPRIRTWSRNLPTRKRTGNDPKLPFQITKKNLREKSHPCGFSRC